MFYSDLLLPVQDYIVLVCVGCTFSWPLSSLCFPPWQGMNQPPTARLQEPDRHQTPPGRVSWRRNVTPEGTVSVEFNQGEGIIWYNHI